MRRITQHLTLIVFCTALAGAVLSLSLPFLAGEIAGIVVTACSVAYSIWAIWTSEHGGFVRTRQMRRAFEPQRHFNGVQVLLLLLLIMIQLGLTSYLLIT